MAGKDINRVTLIGRFGEDPELRTIGEGTSVLNISLATGRSWKSSEGETVERTQWHRLIFWRKAAEIVAQYTKKGSQIYVEGEIVYRKWTDDDGNDHYVTEIECKEFKFLDSRSDSEAVPANPAAANEEEDLTF